MPHSILEKGVPIPPPSRKKHCWAEMEVSDSIFFPEAKITTIKGMVRSAAKRLGFKFTTRKCGMDGVRVWRIE